ncbi:DUF5060 domain-containing protein [Haloferula sp. BvORR071]|uniref:CBM96 family carbohydrate-binding protein n=1 Tax=Haloferula sp. BvORR071 TaxID=1396141 RepID=UPI00094639D9|nr:DUF5060 domain-containing protein [Haloferula sp. BvORR071]
MKTTAILTAIATTALAISADAATVSGELSKWHKVTLSFEGPATSESATPNPFTDYRLNVTFRNAASGKTYLVPGYYAADGNAANTSASSGDVWKVHFAPDETGTWTYTASFRKGTNVAMDASSTAGSSAGFFDGDSGSLSISATNKTGRDLRGKGRLDYVGKHHLRFAETGKYFMKAGVDAPENLLAYTDFDGDFKTDGHKDDLIKDWQPHVQDWNSGDPTWQGGKGKGLIGAINYLSGKGLNVFSFLTMNINGDDQNVYPYTSYSERLRMDVSKLDQWETVFEHGDKMGMYLHFKTQETENELLLDGGNMGNQRKLYYRELIARFAHHLALNWNLGEEINDASTAQKVAWAEYFYDNDPYHHHLVIHNGDSHYEMMGDASRLTGFSRQMNAADFSDTFGDIKNYVDRSDAAGKPWVVAADEPGDSQYGLRPDSDPASSHTNARKDALWATIMAGGAGIEFYFGYALENSDLTCNDFRSRDSFWPYCRYAVSLFENNAIPFQDMSNANSLVSGGGSNGNRCLAKPGSDYLVQLRSGGTSATLNLSGQSGSYRVRWYDPRNGGSLVTGDTLAGGGTRNLGSPPNSTSQDWIAWVQNTGASTPTNQAPMADVGTDKTATLSGSSASVALNGSVTDDGLPTGSSLAVSWTRVSGPAAVTFSSPNSASTSVIFTSTGTYVLRLTGTDGELSHSDDLSVTVSGSSGGGGGTIFAATQDAYLQNGSNVNNGDLRVESSSTRTRVSYLQFDLSGASGTIGNATLRLTQKGDIPSGSMNLRVFAAASNNWQEGTLTSSNAPAKGAMLGSFSGSIPAGVILDFDVSAFVSGPGVYSFILDTDSTRDVTFASSENTTTSAQPLLVISSTGGASNTAPVVSAGADKSGSYQGQAVALTLNGSANDDGLPAGSALSLAWSTTSGPASVSFSPPNAANTSATFNAAGTYVLRLSASDGQLSSSDEVTVTINSVATNQSPTADAGPDASATLTGSSVQVALNGSASDDGLPQGSGLSLAWTRRSGPTAVSFATPNSASTTATFTAEGTYVLRLTASDGQLSDFDEMTVVITAAAAVPGGTTVLAATQDAYTENGKNFNSSVLRVESSSRKRIIYLQFDASAVTAPSSAILKLVEGGDVSSGTMTLRVFAAASNNWSESTVSGSNAPAKGAELASFTGDIPQDKVLSFDVSSQVTAAGIYSFIVEADSSTKDVSFVSAEGSPTSFRPTLTVNSGSSTTVAARSVRAEAKSSPDTKVSMQMERAGSNGVRLTLKGQINTRYAVERSTDLQTWTAIGTVGTGDSGEASFEDTLVPGSNAFYRLNDEVSEP